MFTLTLGELVSASSGLIQTGPFGSQLHAHEYADSGVAVAMPQDIRGGRLIHENIARIPEATAAKLSRHQLQPNDIIYSRRGDVEKNALIRDSDLPAICGTGCLLVRIPKNDGFDARFVSYLLQTDDIKKWVTGHAVGATMPNLNTQVLSEIPLQTPPLPEQQAIAEVLGALDDKIAANRALVTTLLDLGSALYERASCTGKTAQVGDICEFHNKKRVPLSASERAVRQGGVPYWGANGRLGWVDQPIFDGNYVLIGEDGSVVTSQGTPVIHNLWGPAWVNNHAHVLSGHSVSTDLLYFILRRTRVADAVTGAVQPKLSMGKLKSVVVRVPDAATLPVIDAQAVSLLEQTRALEGESTTLTTLRDTLLPALMDGTLRVKDAEKTVSEAL